MTDQVRVRFAPSPTGFPHVGNIRTALFNWLFARHSGGKFIVRIEDTDVNRKVEGAVEAILRGLKWLGLEWDEGPEKGGPFGPYFQSARLHLYREAADRLIAQGDAYKCYCSVERLEAMRAEQTRRKIAPGYDRLCRSLTAPQCAAEEATGTVPVVRFKTPVQGETSFTDVIWGDVKFENRGIDDFVLLKSDGYPTYHLANVVDDHAMQISHVLRAEEWISSTPRHKMLYRALGYEPPVYAHLPMILGPDRSKLSKRHGAVSITEYEDQGYLPETMLNFLALLGWSLDDKTEIMSRDTIARHFSLDRVSKTAAIFNQQKLSWMNGVYIRSLTPDDFARRALPFLEKSLPPDVERPLAFDYVRRVAALIQDRAKTLVEVGELADFFFVDDLRYDAALLTGKGMTRDMALRALEATRQHTGGMPSFDAAALEAMLRPLADALGLTTGQLFGTIRTAVTGRTATPPLFETMSVLGKERCLQRIDRALDKLKGLTPAS